FEMSEILALVIATAAAEERAAGNAWFERGSLPELEGFRGLHVVMAVDEEMGPRFAVGTEARSFGDDDRVSLGRAEARIEADILGVVDDPFGAGLEVGTMLRLGGNAGEPDIIAELVDEARLIGPQVVGDALHRELIAVESGACHYFFRNRLSRSAGWVVAGLLVVEPGGALVEGR